MMIETRYAKMSVALAEMLAEFHPRRCEPGMECRGCEILDEWFPGGLPGAETELAEARRLAETWRARTATLAAAGNLIMFDRELQQPLPWQREG